MGDEDLEACEGCGGEVDEEGGTFCVECAGEMAGDDQGEDVDDWSDGDADEIAGESW